MTEETGAAYSPPPLFVLVHGMLLDNKLLLSSYTQPTIVCNDESHDVGTWFRIRVSRRPAISHLAISETP